MNNLLKTLCVLFFCITTTSRLKAQNIATKTDFAYWAMAATPNLAMEFALNRKYTLEIGGGYNFFSFKDNKKLKHWSIQPELRYWTCESFNGHFFGLHALAFNFNAGGVKLPFGILSKIKDHRYEGYAFGGGLSYGHQWVLNSRWNFELSLGGGYIYLKYDKFNCVKCSKILENDIRKHYFGITKAAISIIYFIK